MGAKFPTYPPKDVKKPSLFPLPKNLKDFSVLREKILAELSKLNYNSTINADERDGQNYENGEINAYRRVLEMIEN